MPIEKLTIDELAGRGLEKVRDPTELDWTLTAVIMAIPKTVPKEKVLEMFDVAWKCCRGD